MEEKLREQEEEGRKYEQAERVLQTETMLKYYEPL